MAHIGELNQDESGLRALMLRTRRHLDDLAMNGTPLATPADAKRELIAADSRWGDANTWNVLARAVHPLTTAYLLRAVNHRSTADGGIVAMSADEGAYLPILARTFWISLIVTAIVVVLGYPLTYWLAQLPARRQRRVLMAVLIPFWTSILVRICAWMVVLPREGIVNKIRISMHLLDSPFTLLYNRTGVIISMVHILIPFMVLPLFAVMRGIPPTYQRAAISLGSHPFGAFWRVYVPQTAPGVAAGALLVAHCVTATGKSMVMRRIVVRASPVHGRGVFTLTQIGAGNKILESRESACPGKKRSATMRARPPKTVTRFTSISTTGA